MSTINNDIIIGGGNEHHFLNLSETDNLFFFGKNMEKITVSDEILKRSDIYTPNDNSERFMSQLHRFHDCKPTI